MITLRKTTFLRSLIFGTSFLILLLTGCRADDGDVYWLQADFKFINELQSPIELTVSSDQIVALDPTQESPWLNVGVETFNEIEHPIECCHILLESIVGNGSLEITVVGDSCLLFYSENAYDLINYSYEKINDRHFRYTYRITDLDVSGQAYPCE
jgi:hypothetical protein